MPSCMTFDQALQCSRAYSSSADDIAHCHLEHFHELTEAQHRKLHKDEDALRKLSREMLAEATSIVWDDLQTTLKNIRAATDKMRVARAHLKSVQRALAFAAQALTLGSAILSANPIAIGTASLQLAELVEQFRDEDDQEADEEGDAVGG